MNKSFHLGIALFLVAGGAYLGIRHQKTFRHRAWKKTGRDPSEPKEPQKTA